MPQPKIPDDVLDAFAVINDYINHQADAFFAEDNGVPTRRHSFWEDKQRNWRKQYRRVQLREVQNQLNSLIDCAKVDSVTNW